MNMNLFNPDLPLVDYQLLSPEMIEKLAVYRISTIGELLGATKGLTHHLEIFETEGEKESMNSLIQNIPQDIIDYYQSYHFNPPMGLNPNKDENENDNSATERG